MNSTRIKAALLLVFAFATMTTVQSAAAVGDLFLYASIACDSDAGDIILGATGFVTSFGVGAAGILLCVNPWLVLGVATAYGA